MKRNFRKCLITGISGSGGSYLAEYILKKDKKIKIYGFYRKIGHAEILKKKFNKRIFLIKQSLENVNILKKKIIKIKPDLIYHLASNADVLNSFKFPHKIIKNNLLITLNLLEALRLSKINSLFILCSTSEVYGNVNKQDLPIKENLIMSPASPYAASKSFQDILAQTYIKSYKLKIIITRMFSYINARRINLFQSAFAKQIADIEKGKKNILIHGNLKSIRTVIDTEDAMSAYWLAATKGKIGEIYNIGGNKKISVGNFLKQLANKSSKKIVFKKSKKLVRPKDVTLQIPSSKKFYKHTKWRTKVPLNKSMLRLLETFRQR